MPNQLLFHLFVGSVMHTKSNTKISTVIEMMVHCIYKLVCFITYGTNLSFPVTKFFKTVHSKRK
jgi:hypothetical protein